MIDGSSSTEHSRNSNNNSSSEFLYAGGESANSNIGGGQVNVDGRLDNSDYNSEQQHNDAEGSSGSTSVNRSQAAFVNKLYKMLEDSSIRHLISWSETGDLFSVTNPTAFSRTVLPQYFKHNNWQSFVRQLNMYGFHKVNDMIHSNLTTENQNWEFRHPHFRRGAIEDLKNIKRKSAKSRHHLQQRAPLSTYQNEGDEFLYGPMYKHILDMEERLHSMSKAYEILHHQTSSLRSVLTGQQEVIANIAEILITASRVPHVGAFQNVNHDLKQQLTKLQELSNAMISYDHSTEGIQEGSTSNSHPSSIISTSSRSQGLSSSTFPGPPATSSLYRTGKSPQRLPSIGAFSATIGNLGAAVLRPPVGYSPPNAEDSNRSGSVSPLLDGSTTDRMATSPCMRSRVTSPEEKSFPGDYAPSRPLTALLSLGTHSQLLNPASDDEQDTNRTTRNNVKRLRPNEL